MPGCSKALGSVGARRGGEGCIALIASAAAVGASIVGSRARPPGRRDHARVRGPHCTSTGVVYSYGVAEFGGSPGSTPPAPLVGITGKSDGSGYWAPRPGGGVYHYGSAIWYGAPATLPGGIPTRPLRMAGDPERPRLLGREQRRQRLRLRHRALLTASGGTGGIVGIAPTPTATATGSPRRTVACTPSVTQVPRLGVRSSEPRRHHVVSSTPSEAAIGSSRPTAASYGFGAAMVPGSAGVAQHPIVGLAATVTGAGYRLVDSNGGVFTVWRRGAPRARPRPARERAGSHDPGVPGRLRLRPPW